MRRTAPMLIPLLALVALAPACRRQDTPLVEPYETARHAGTPRTATAPAPTTLSELQTGAATTGAEPLTDDFRAGSATAAPAPEAAPEAPLRQASRGDELPRPSDRQVRLPRRPTPPPPPATRDARQDTVEDVQVEPAPRPATDRDERAADERATRDSEPELTSVTVPVGTSFSVSLDDSLSSQTARVGDEVRATVARDVRVDGVVAIPAGSEVRGTVTEAQALRRVGGQARLGFDFDEVRLPSGRTVPIETSFSQVGRSETRRDAATIGGSAAAGAVLGRILSGHKDSGGRGTLAGAAAGAVIGTVIAARTAGETVEVPAGTAIELAIDRSVRIPVRVDRR